MISERLRDDLARLVDEYGWMGVLKVLVNGSDDRASDEPVIPRFRLECGCGQVHHVWVENGLWRSEGEPAAESSTDAPFTKDQVRLCNKAVAGIDHNGHEWTTSNRAYWCRGYDSEDRPPADDKTDEPQSRSRLKREAVQRGEPIPTFDDKTPDPVGTMRDDHGTLHRWCEKHQTYHPDADLAAVDASAVPCAQVGPHVGHEYVGQGRARWCPGVPASVVVHEQGRKHSQPWCLTHDAPMVCSADSASDELAKARAILVQYGGLIDDYARSAGYGEPVRDFLGYTAADGTAAEAQS